jgi:hypothetical protein
MGGLELEASGLATVMGRLDACELTWGGGLDVRAS